MNPDVYSSDHKECLKAGRNALPADHQTAILFLEPGKGPLRLESRDDFFDGSPPIFLGLPDPLWNLRTDTSLSQLLPERFGIIAFIRRDDLQAFTGTGG